MNRKREIFWCFRCHYLNNVIVPHHFKGLRCKRCNSFNYFNYIPNYKKRNNNLNNLNHNHLSNNNKTDNKSPFDYNNNNNHNDDIRLNIMNFYNKLSAINNNIINDTSSNNFNQNQINTRPQINNNLINNNLINSYPLNILPRKNNFISIKIEKEEKEEELIIPWLNKQKFTEEIKNKYKDEKCSICLEEFNGNVSLTKCNHIFHYICLARCINNTQKQECPICRSDLITGAKKEVEVDVNRNNFQNQNDEIRLIRNIINSNNQENHRIRYNPRNLVINRPERNTEQNCNETLNKYGALCLVIIFIYIIFKYNWVFFLIILILVLKRCC